jgi:putative ATP-binding cassette transporter
MDESAETAMYDLIGQRLPGATVISVGHRSSLRQLHGEELTVANGTIEPARRSAS